MEARVHKKKKFRPHYFLGKISMKRLGASLDMLERKHKALPAGN